MSGTRATLALVAALCLPVTLLHGSGTVPARFQFEEPAMGTLFTIQVHAASREEAAPAVAAAWKRVHALNRIFSDYDPESELQRFCRQPPATRVPLSPELHGILTRAQALAQRTGGAFDVTMGPLKRLWRQTRRDGRLPAPEKLEAALRRCGYRHLTVFPDGTASLAMEGMRLDLGGIAKGFAADEALRVLRDHGFPASLVAASGDIAVGDAPPGTSGWSIGLSSVSSGGKPDQTIELANAAVSTSGDTYQFVEIAGRRYSHILDPATGLGLRQPRSVNVIARHAVETDSLATACSILGKAGLEALAFSGARIRIVEAEDVQIPDGAVPAYVTHLANWDSDPPARSRTPVVNR